MFFAVLRAEAPPLFPPPQPNAGFRGAPPVSAVGAPLPTCRFRCWSAIPVPGLLGRRAPRQCRHVRRGFLARTRGICQMVQWLGWQAPDRGETFFLLPWRDAANMYSTCLPSSPPLTRR